MRDRRYSRMANDPEESQTRHDPVLDDTRRLPRVVVRRPARVLVAGGEQVSAMVYDVSPDGLQLRCSRAAASAIHPGGHPIRPGEDTPRVGVMVRLPAAGGAINLRVLGKLSFFSLIAPDVAAMGVRLIGVSPEDARRLDRFWMAALEPAEIVPAGPPPAPRPVEGADGAAAAAPPRQAAGPLKA